MTTITNDLIAFVKRTKFEDLPRDVVHEVKRGILDSTGCALAGTATDKGKIAAYMAKRLGGVKESTVVGLGNKVSCTIAAMVNGELINSLDFDALPHIHPFVVPSVLATAESVHASGKDLIVAMAIAHEISRRLNLAMSTMLATLAEKAKTPDVFGNGNEFILGAAAGVGKILNLLPEQIAHALGIAGYLCSLPVCRDWEDTMPKSMIKYSPVGWNCQGAVMAGLLAEQGFTGNPTILDNKYGFPKFYGAERWEPEIVVNSLGDKWELLDVHYKPYPCCRFLHSPLDCFIDIVEMNNLKPDDIESVKVYSLPFVAHPDQLNVTTQIDAQFSLPFVIAVAAHGIKSGVNWQDINTIQNPKIQLFMKKVSMIDDPKAGEEKRKDRKSWFAKVEVVANGKTYVKETLYSKGTNVEGFRLSDQELFKKFKDNAARLLTENKICEAANCIMELEKVEDVSDLVKLLVL